MNPLITSHVYRPHTAPPKGLPEHGCAYLGCGQPPDAHERHVSRHRPAPVCTCGHEGLDPVFHLGCPVGALRRQRELDSGPGRVAPVGERGAGEHDPGRDTPGAGDG